MPLSFTNLTRANEIGANSYYLGVDGSGFLLDSGVHPKLEGNASKPMLELVQFKTVHSLLLSHCHLDHVGSLPVAAHQHPEMEIIMTVPSLHLIERILHNSVNIMTRQREELQLVEYPFFTHNEVERLSGRFSQIHYNRTVPIDLSSTHQAQVTFHEAGHIQGAAGILIEAEGKRVFYTGDVNFRDQKITRRAHFPEEKIDVLIAETTRGAKAVSPQWSWDNEERKLGAAIREVLDGDGSVLIPIFALGKTQEMLFMVWEMMQKRVIPQQKIYMGGLGSTITQIHDNLASQTPRLNAGFKFRDEMDLEVIEYERTRDIPLRGGKLMLISAGMMTPQTSSYILGQRMLENPRHGIFFVGYCDPASPAAQILATPPNGQIQLETDGPILTRRCRLEHFDFSSHCNREEMLDYMIRVKPKLIFLVHGDVSALQWFESELKEKLPGSTVVIPEPGKEYAI